MKVKNFKSFFKGDLLFVVDAMCCRYHKLPSEILDLPLQEFNFNVAIFLQSIQTEKKQHDEQMENIKKYGTPIIKGNNLSFGGFGLKRIKKVKQKKEK